MIDLATLHRWGFSLLYLVLAGAIIFMRLLPFGGGGMPPPNLILLVGFAWVLRRPDYLPVWLFATVLLMTELLFQHPPGIGAGVAVIALEFLRGRAILMRQQSFTMEWITVGLVLIAMLLGERLLLALFVVDQVSFGLSVLSLAVNIMFYPLVVAVSIFLFHVRRLTPGEHVGEARLL